MDTDQALSIATIVGLLTICACGIVSVCYRTRAPSVGHMKVSRSDPDLENLQDLVADSIPSHK